MKGKTRAKILATSFVKLVLRNGIQFEICIMKLAELFEKKSLLNYFIKTN